MTTVLPKIVFVIALVPAAAAATHLSFFAAVDSFSVAGPSRTPFVDDFDDGVISPWVVSNGSPVETGGFVELASPGSPQGSFDRETIHLDGITFDGGGDFVAESSWLAAVPAPNNAFFMISNELDGVGGFRTHTIGLTACSGLFCAIFHQVFTDTGGSVFLEVVNIPSVAIMLATDGRILFRQVFDDTTNQLTSSYSLDGGFTYSSFTPDTIGQMDGQFLLSAQAFPEPSAPVLMALVLVLVRFAFLSEIPWMNNLFRNHT